VPVAERVAFARKHFSRSKEDVANVGMAHIAD